MNPDSIPSANSPGTLASLTLNLASTPVYPCFLSILVPDISSRVSTLMTLPDSKIRAGRYSLFLYPPLEAVQSLVQVYGVYPFGTQPRKARTKQEVEDTHPLGYVFTSSLPPQETPTSVLFRSRQRVLNLNLDVLDAQTLSSQGIDAQLLFRGPHFTLHHAVNTFTLISSIHLPDRLLNVLTSV